MKKIDVLILKALVGPLILTYFVVVFLLLLQFMLSYVEDFIGKDVGLFVFLKMIGFFSLTLTPMALPLAVLLSCLITFGNLGEHFELTAIKSAGVSLIRVLLPLGVLAAFLSVFTYWFSDRVVPFANLKAFSTLYNIRTTKAALNLKEGSFYTGMPGYSIKVDKKFPDGKTLKGMTIYNHAEHVGNKEVILADSGLMYTTDDGNFLVMDLHRGNIYTDGKGTDKPAQLTRHEFKRAKMRFDMSSFDTKDIGENAFMYHRMMKNNQELHEDVDSMIKRYDIQTKMYVRDVSFFHTYFNAEKKNLPYIPYEQLPNTKKTEKKDTSKEVSSSFFKNMIRKDSSKKENINKENIKKDTIKNATKDTNNLDKYHSKNTPQDIVSINNQKNTQQKSELKQDSSQKYTPTTSKGQILISPDISKIKVTKLADSLWKVPFDSVHTMEIISGANQKASDIRNFFQPKKASLMEAQKEISLIDIEIHRKYSVALACFLMFLIGAPLGAIIKKGGLGVPTLISVFFFILYYVFTMTGEKWSKEGVTPIWIGMWMADAILLVIGLFLLNQARNDSRVFDKDVYVQIFRKIKSSFQKKT